MSRTPFRIMTALLVVLATSVGSHPVVAQETEEADGARDVPSAVGPAGVDVDNLSYRVLATRRAATLERELNEAAEGGFRLHEFTWRDCDYGDLPPFPGDRCELMVVVVRDARAGRYRYRVLRRSREASLESALNEAAEAGFRTRALGQAIILERDDAGARPEQYLVVTTSKISTLEAEIAAALHDGYAMVGMLPPAPVEGLVAVLSRPGGGDLSAAVP